MPFVTSGFRKGGRSVAAAMGLALTLAAPAPAAPPSATEPSQPNPPGNLAHNPDGCVVAHQLSNPFTAWLDFASYALAPGGDFETGAAGWTLSGGATVAGGNQPFAIGTSGGSSLSLPPESSATSAPMCIDSTYPHFRIFARNIGAGRAPLAVEVLFLDAGGNIRSTASGNVLARTDSWFPSDSLEIDLTFDGAVAAGAAPVAFRFATRGRANAWLVDDVYVDPYARR